MDAPFAFMCGVVVGVLVSLAGCWALSLLIDEPMIGGRK